MKKRSRKKKEDMEEEEVRGRGRKKSRWMTKKKINFVIPKKMEDV